MPRWTGTGWLSVEPSRSKRPRGRGQHCGDRPTPRCPGSGPTGLCEDRAAGPPAPSPGQRERPFRSFGGRPNAPSAIVRPGQRVIVCGYNIGPARVVGDAIAVAAGWDHSPALRRASSTQMCRGEGYQATWWPGRPRSARPPSRSSEFSSIVMHRATGTCPSRRVRPTSSA
jgi:hypothetical protein